MRFFRAQGTKMKKPEPSLADQGSSDEVYTMMQFFIEVI